MFAVSPDCPWIPLTQLATPLITLPSPWQLHPSPTLPNGPQIHVYPLRKAVLSASDCHIDTAAPQRDSKPSHPSHSPTLHMNHCIASCSSMSIPNLCLVISLSLLSRITPSATVLRSGEPIDHRSAAEEL